MTTTGATTRVAVEEDGVVSERRGGSFPIGPTPAWILPAAAISGGEPLLWTDRQRYFDVSFEASQYSTLRYNPQPTQPSDDASVVIVVGGDGSGYGNDDSDYVVGDSDDGVDGGGNGSGDGSGIDDGDGGDGGSGDEEVAATAMAAGANNNQLKAGAE
jgi:hypothetical protein